MTTALDSINNRKPRVRFAPSPTGPLHIGGVRTALYNWLFAKKHGGTFILRIEDTDQQRFVPGAEEYIIETFKWLDIDFDEGVHIGGKFAPYRQSEREEIYMKYAQYLVENNWAYYAFDTPETLDEKRREFERRKETFQYGTLTRASMCNSLTLSAQEVNDKINTGTPYVIRFKYPDNHEIVVEDMIRGTVKVNSSLLDDKVLFKSDGMPTYHLANVVDDHLMEITHVIRGEEWLPSTPLHQMLYQAFDWAPPQFAHLPLLLKPDGNGKLSKRDGDRLGFPVFPLQWKDPQSRETSSGYRESGYLPDALINMLALLGWNPGTEQEIMSKDELIRLFSIEKVSKSGAKFNLEKAKWFNQQYIQKLSVKTLTEQFLLILKKHNIDAPAEYVENIVALVKERISFINDLWEESNFFFIAPTSFDEQIIKKRWKEDTPQRLKEIAQIIGETSPFQRDSLHNAISEYITQNNLNMGQIMNCLRLSLVGAAKGPDLFEIINLLGANEVVKRINNAISTIAKNNI